MLNYNLLKKTPMILILLFVLFVTGCTSASDSIDLSGMYTVVYDGNGGYLGNKAATIRKLKVAPNSKIPKYLQDSYVQDPYVVSSLGNAILDGYLLQGWYLEENATYVEDELGTSVHLDLNENNGIYNYDDNGGYVFVYVPQEDGRYIYVYLEIPSEGTDTTKLEYIYFNGSNGYGYYIYDPDNADHAAIYDANGSKKYDDVKHYGTYLSFDELTDEEKVILSEAPRFNGGFREYTEADVGFDRYNLTSGYAEILSMMETNSNGSYVFLNDRYEVYDQENPEHQGKPRYSINPKYKFTPTGSILSPSDMTKYRPQIIYWNFETQRVTKDITLKAHWIKACTVVFETDGWQTLQMTTKLNPQKTGSVPLENGLPIGLPESYAKDIEGKTFVGWSKSKTEYIPWDFENDVFPVGTDTLTLYGYMISGTYTRITTASELEKVVNDPAGNYLLCNDIDLQGAEYVNKTPLGFAIQANVGAADPIPFTGKFYTLGSKISNFTLKVRNSQKRINENAGVVVVSGLFPYVQNATIEGLTVENMTVVIDTTVMGTNVICDLGSGALIGTALEGNTVVTNCNVDVRFESSSANVIDSTVYVGDIVARGAEYTTVTDTTATIDYSEIDGITTGTLEVHTLN